MPTEEDYAAWRDADRQDLINPDRHEWEPPKAKEGDLKPISADEQGQAFNPLAKVGKWFTSDPTLDEHRRIKAMPEGEEKESC